MKTMTQSRARTVAALAALAALLSSATAFAAIDMFAQIPGIPGGSSTSGRSGWIDVDSFRLSSSRAPGSTTPMVDALTFEHSLDQSSPLLFRSLASGTPLASLTIESVRAGVTKALMPHRRVRLTNARVVAIRQVGSFDSMRETVTLSFDRITIEDWRIGPDGTRIDPPRSMTYDLTTGTVL